MAPKKTRSSAAKSDVTPDSATKKTANSEQPVDVGNRERRIRKEKREMAKRRKLNEMAQGDGDGAQQKRPVDAVNAQQTHNTDVEAQVSNEPSTKKRKTSMSTPEGATAIEETDEPATMTPRNAGDDDRNRVGRDKYHGLHACPHAHTFPEDYVHTASCLSAVPAIEFATNANEEGVEHDHALCPWKAINFTIEGQDGSVECSERLFESCEALRTVVTHFELSHEHIEMPLPISDLKTVEGVQDSLEHLEYDSNGEASAESDIPGQFDDFFCLSSAEKEDVWKMSDYLMKERRCQC